MKNKNKKYAVVVDENMNFVRFTTMPEETIGEKIVGAIFAPFDYLDERKEDNLFFKILYNISQPIFGSIFFLISLICIIEMPFRIIINLIRYLNKKK